MDFLISLWSYVSSGLLAASVAGSGFLMGFALPESIEIETSVESPSVDLLLVDESIETLDAVSPKVATTSSENAMQPLVFYTNNQATVPLLDERFVGLLSHVHWLLDNQKPAFGVVDDKDFVRLHKQIFSFMDDMGEDMSDLRADITTGGDFTDATLISPIFTGAIASNLTLGSNWLSGDGDDEGIVIDSNGNVGIGTSTPSQLLTVAGHAYITGAIYDSTNSAGTSGYVLQTTGSGTVWVATSTLGLGGSGGLFAADIDTSAELAAILSDETGTGSLVFSISPILTGTLDAEAADFSSTLTLSGSAANIALGSNYLSGDGGDEGIFVDATGQVGIGTTTPTTLLHLMKSSSSYSNFITLHNTSASDTRGAAILFESANYPNQGQARIGSTRGENGSSADIHIEVETGNVLTEILTIDGSDFAIGIGTTTPSSLLTVAGSSLFTGTMTLSGSAANIALGSNYLSGDGGDEGIFVDGSGKVGIGTSSPGALLHVTGSNVGDFAAEFYNLDATGHGLYGYVATSSANIDVLRLEGTTGQIFNVKADGKVGIGTTTPLSQLALYNSADAATSFVISTPGTLSAQNANMNFITKHSSLDLGQSSVERGWQISARGNAYSNAAAQNDIGFHYWDGSVWNSAMSIDSVTRNVGIGTSTPQTKLHVVGEVVAESSNAFRMVSGNYGAFWRHDGTNTYFLLTNSGNQYGTYNSLRPLIINDSTGLVTMQNGLTMGGSASNITLGSNYLSGDGDDEGIYIGTAGSVGIGTSSPGTKLHVDGNMFAGVTYNGNPALNEVAGVVIASSGYVGAYRSGGAAGIFGRDSAGGVVIQFYGGGTVAGNISNNVSNSTSYNATSDRRVKENIQQTKLGLEDLMQIPVNDFIFKSDPTKATTTGFIAQELYEVFPWAVTTNGDNGIDPLAGNSFPWSVDYGRITPLIVKSVQDLNLKLEDLATTTNFLELANDSFVKKVFNGLITWFADATNGIGSMYANIFNAKEKICINNTCLNEHELQELLDLRTEKEGGDGFYQDEESNEVVDDEEVVLVVDEDMDGLAGSEDLEGVIEVNEEVVVDEIVAEDTNETSVFELGSPAVLVDESIE